MSIEKAPSKKTRHGFIHILVCLIFLGLSLDGWIRLAEDILDKSLVITWAGYGIWIYLLIYGAFWGMIGMAALLIFWMNPPWMKLAGWVAIFFFPLTFWTEKLFIQQSPIRLVNWAFDAGITLLWIILASLALRHNLRRQTS